MNDLQQGLQILNDTIARKLQHQDYTHVTELAKEYFDIFTATKEGISPYLKKYRNNESDESFKQMLEIYESTIPSVVNNLSTIFEKPLRSNRVYSSIDGNNQAREEILNKLKTFWQGETESGIDAYLKERWKHLVFYDPNAFIAIEFSSFDPVKEKPQPFAVEYTSKEAINYLYDATGVLSWLICEKQIQYKSKEAQEIIFKDGSKFIMYLDNQAIVYTEVEADPAKRVLEGQPGILVEIYYPENKAKQKPDRAFLYVLFETKSMVLPAFRVGYMPDAVTNQRTCISAIHHALPFFKKELKSGVELDLTIKAHVFPQKFMYGPKCEGNPEEGIKCIDGKAPNGGICPVCNGTKVMPVHTTATDLVVIPMPTKDNQPVINLQQAMAYFSPPLDLVKFMEEYCDRLTEKAKGAVFPSTVVAASQNKMSSSKSGRTNTGTTATEQDYSWDSVYDAYRPFTAKYSYAWLFIVKLTAIYTDNYSDSLVLYHKFPSDFKLKTVQQLLQEATEADQSNLPQHIKDAIYDDIANVYYADDQDTLTKITVKNKFHPFSGKSETEIQTLLMRGGILPYYETLYTYFDIIFDGIDNEIGDAFYIWTYQKQKGEIDKRVNELLGQVEDQKAQALKEAQKNLRLQLSAKDQTLN